MSSADNEVLPEETADTGIPTDSVERLSSGKALTAQEAYQITASVRTRLIVLAGMPESGKTTLIASLFHYFQRGEFAGFYFAGSTTLLGFDARCHDARVRSRRTTPTTERTKSGISETLLHLRVKHKDDPLIRDLLFVDISGEHYDAMRDSVEECHSVPWLRRADHFVLLIDGERLGDLQLRQGAKTNARLILRSCFDSGELKSTAIVDVLVNKWDMVQNSKEADEFASDLEAEFQQQFASRCARFRISRIAARPTTTALPLGWGMADVFSGWINDIPEDFFVPARATIQETFTEFDRLGSYYG